MKAKFITIWDGGVEVETDCQYNAATGEVFDIEVFDGDEVEELETLDRTFIRLEDGVELDVEEYDGRSGDYHIV